MHSKYMRDTEIIRRLERLESEDRIRKSDMHTLMSKVGILISQLHDLREDVQADKDTWRKVMEGLK
jgi:polyhydroxyalkanoate synthesis regulator phasin